ncbi:integrase core domain-containing protein [Cryobacterium sp. Y57]|uniref:integrase core domain-containing protein n=1 Tax=Cryobacterium sp. Y57 TaxID=2048287 RepID=UPI000CE4D371|nr:integrase core domain-containing protein [Cryobacterium sp. Y57]
MTKSHSRPHTSNDNPFSESHFKILKYISEFHDRFYSLAEARSCCTEFYDWYNGEHRHSGIGMHTPFNVHYGRAPFVQYARARVLTTAYADHPERLVRQHPQPPTFPTTTWINEPEKAKTNSMTG